MCCVGSGIGSFNTTNELFNHLRGVFDFECKMAVEGNRIILTPKKRIF